MTTRRSPMVSTMMWRFRPGIITGVISPGRGGNGVCTLDALGIDDRRGWRLVTAICGADLAAEGVVESVKRAVVTPALEVPVDGLPRGS
jgi:hypothetical protein